MTSASYFAAKADNSTHRYSTPATFHRTIVSCVCMNREARDWKTIISILVMSRAERINSTKLWGQTVRLSTCAWGFFPGSRRGAPLVRAIEEVLGGRNRCLLWWARLRLWWSWNRCGSGDHNGQFVRVALFTTLAAPVGALLGRFGL